MEIGKVVSDIRNKKNIKVNQLIGTRMTRSTYTRFIAGQIDTSASNFIFMLNRMHVTYDEFLYIKDGYMASRFDGYLAELQTAVLSSNLNQIQKIETESELIFKNENSIEYQHLYYTCKIFEGKLNHQELDEDAKDGLIKYLMDTEFWTHYELVLFNNIMFIFDIEMMDLIIDRVLRNIKKYNSMNKYGNESFRVLINCLIRYIDTNNFIKAKRTLHQIEKIKLRDDMLFEKCLLKFFQGIIMIVTGDSRGIKQAQESIQVWEILQIKSEKNIANMYLKNIIAKFVK